MLTQELDRQLSEILGPLMMHLAYAKRIYASYIASGNLFKYAVLLRKVNTEIKRLVLTKGFLLPNEHQAVALNIVEHIDVWLVLWKEQQRNLMPKLEDTFIFENGNRFPRDSEVVLTNYYQDIVARG